MLNVFAAYIDFAWYKWKCIFLKYKLNVNKTSQNAQSGKQNEGLNGINTMAFRGLNLNSESNYVLWK